MAGLKICCVKQGDKYTSEQVNILFDMVCRNLIDVEFHFSCFTDNPEGLHKDINVFETPSDLNGWWAKLALFQEGVFEHGDRVVYLDLSCVIVGSIHFLAEYDGKFAILRDFYRPNGLQSAVMAWPGGWGAHIWNEWEAHGRPQPVGGDQEWIERMVPDAVRMQDLWPGLIVSYKLHCMGRPTYPTGARIVKFHGIPKPEHCGDRWVRHLYKVGADVANNIKLEFNLDTQNIRDNVRVNSQRKLPWLTIKEPNDAIVAIVGGGPSALDQLHTIKEFYENGVHIWALNGSAKWLASHGIIAHRHILLDARPDNIAFLDPEATRSYCIASQCDPSLFGATGGRPVTVFHAYSEETEPHIENPYNQQLTLVAAGSTVGLAAMTIAYAEGCRTLHLFGYDSSYSEYGHHAYEQELNNDELVIQATVGDRVFNTCAWMASQANEWQHTASELANGGMAIAVHGDGLLPEVAKQLSLIQDEGGYKRIGGFLWPSDDTQASMSVLENLEDVHEVLKYVPAKNVAVQAGGNVGVYPKELGKFFKRVYTFEPDSKNYACMQDNVPENNVVKYRAALGAERGRVGLSRVDDNCGAHFMVSGDEVQLVAIDDLHLDQCDLIYLDVEGYEMHALKGASETIRKFKPVIVAEDKGLSERYGVEEGAISSWLTKEFGYVQAGRLGQDVIMTAA